MSGLALDIASRCLFARSLGADSDRIQGWFASFTDYFIVCTGASSRQIQAIVDEIGLQLKELGEYPLSLEGYTQAEWVLVDYGDLVIHIFSEKARGYYDLERLWRDAKQLTWKS